MKTLALTLLTLGMMLGTSTTEAAIRVKVGPVRVAAGRRIPHRHLAPVHVAPRPIIHHAHPVAAAASLAGAVAERRDTVRDIREERLDTFQDLVEERVDTVRDVREERRQAAWNLFLSN